MHHGKNDEIFEVGNSLNTKWGFVKSKKINNIDENDFLVNFIYF